MRISPINNRQNQVSHKAVNQKFLKQVINLKQMYGECPPIGSILQDIDIAVMFGKMSKQDTIDTLIEIKKQIKNANQAIDDTIKNLLKWGN